MSDATVVQLSPRGGDVRCAYCHDPLAEPGAGVACPVCATRLHADCIVEARCPTLGCEHQFAAPKGGFRVDVEGRSRGELPARSRGRLLASTLFGLGLPLLCFGFNEGGTARGELLPEWQSGDGAWWRLVYASEVQVYLYPLLAWAMAALVAACFERRAAWIRVGLTGGVILAAAFSVAFLPLVPLSVVGLIVYGLGLLGLGPFFALGAYSRALWRYRRERPAADEKSGTEVDEGSARAPWAVWTLLGSAGLVGAVHEMNALWARLPTQPPDDCFIASAAARGHARVVGAVPVRFADGRVLPVTRQLRALKAAELALLAFTPRLHRAMRVVYDRAGPPLAARLGRTTGTIAWVLLLPMQALAEVGLRLLFRDAARLIARTYMSDGARALT